MGWIDESRHPRDDHDRNLERSRSCGQLRCICVDRKDVQRADADFAVGWLYGRGRDDVEDANRQRERDRQRDEHGRSGFEWVLAQI